ncbi:MAG TPA: ABC transporter permease [Acidimicrobiales bacterium]|nr:ABC transporter permease [Acidimicrobiales bacterium]
MTALGLAAGVGLVMGIVGVSQGLSDAQNQVLSPLGSVGTDIIVTRTIAPTTSQATTTTTTPDRFGGGGNNGNGGGPGGGGGFFARGVPGASANGGDTQAATLLDNNASVITDLSKLGKPGTKFTHDFFVPGTLITFPSVAVSDIEKIPGVTAAVGALSLQALHETGTVPTITDTVTTGGQKLNTTVKPPALTAAQTAAERSCIQSVLQKEFSSGSFTPGSGGPPGGGNSGGGGRPDFGGFASNPDVQKCLTPAQKSYVQQVVVPQQTIRRVLNPPSTDTSTSSYTVAGVDPTNQSTGLITKSQLVSGRWFDSNPTDEVLVNNAYASTKKLAVGRTLTINGKTYKIVGLVSPTLTGNVADVYFPLSTMQTLSSAPKYVNEVLVAVKSSKDVAAVSKQIKAELPGATVLTSKNLADQVTGSLDNAHKLATDLGGALAIIVLLAAFLIAALLTLSSVSKRVREIGSLRAIGWSRGAVVRQIVAETFGIGIVGGVLGVILGVAICAAIGAIGPGLSVTSTGLAVGASTLGDLVHQSTTGTVSTVVHLSAPLSATTIVIAFACAVLGGVVAGLIGGWRAARLAPAEALRDLG